MNFFKYVIWRVLDVFLSMIGNISNVIFIFSGGIINIGIEWWDSYGIIGY